MNTNENNNYMGRDFDAELDQLKRLCEENNALHAAVIESLNIQLAVEPIKVVSNVSSTSGGRDAK